MSRDDFDLEQERHQRRIMLMRMQGETNRMELRQGIMLAVSVFLGVLAIFLSLQ